MLKHFVDHLDNTKGLDISSSHQNLVEELPKLTFPVVGIGIGYPNQDPQLKPRMNMDKRVFENKYNKFPNYLDELKDYDEVMQTYYDLRDANNRVDSFTDQVETKTRLTIKKRKEILNVVKDQGFDLMLKD